MLYNIKEGRYMHLRPSCQSIFRHAFQRFILLLIDSNALRIDSHRRKAQTWIQNKQQVCYIPTTIENANCDHFLAFHDQCLKSVICHCHLCKMWCICSITQGSFGGGSQESESRYYYLPTFLVTPPFSDIFPFQPGRLRSIAFSFLGCIRSGPGHRLLRTLRKQMHKWVGR